MTRAPASASRQLHIGAATACSSETTSSPSSGRVTTRLPVVPAERPGSSPGRAPRETCPRKSGGPQSMNTVVQTLHGSCSWIPARARFARLAGTTHYGHCITSIRAREAEHVLGQIGEDQVGRDRRNLVEPRLAELALDVELLREADAA